MKYLLKNRKDLLLPGALLLAALAAISIAGDSGDFAITVLSFLAVMTILADTPVIKPIDSSGFNIRVPLALGLALILVVAGYRLLDPVVSTRILPLLLLLTLWFVQLGQGLFHRYWKPLLILGLLAIPDRALMTPLAYPVLQLFGWDAMTYPTAEVSTWLTSLFGLPARLEQLNIITEYATVTIWEGCDAVRNMGFLLRLSIILILTVPVKASRWLLTVVVAVLLGFFINTLRITLLVFLTDYGNMAAFDYWHEGDGSKIFNLLAITLFGFFAYFQVEQKHSLSPSTGSPELDTEGKE